jgi:hypothetical protein
MVVVVRGEILVVMRGEMVINEPPPPITSAWQSVRDSMMRKIKGRHEAARLNERSGALSDKNQANVALGILTRISHRILTCSGAIRTYVLAVVDSKCSLAGGPRSAPPTAITIATTFTTLKGLSVEIRNQFKSH